jgi:hypothetical protein
MRRLLRNHAKSYPVTIRAVMGPLELDCTAVHTGGYNDNQMLLAVTTD